MKILSLIIGIILVCHGMSEAKMIEVKTGYGYIKNSQGNIISKCELPLGIHEIDVGEDYIEVDNPDKLKILNIYKHPKSIKKIQEEKIQKRMRKLAIDQLKAEGNLPPDYND